jgi:CxxC-x17-CxxC domain-containing protein
VVFQDRSLTCVECGASFTFSADDQQYHADKGYTNEPKRCTACREARRSERRGAGGGGGGGGGGGFGGGTMMRQMHPVVCAQCGVDTEVPFRPRGDRPVYCSDCYGKIRDQGAPRY